MFDVKFECEIMGEVHSGIEDLRLGFGTVHSGFGVHPGFRAVHPGFGDVHPGLGAICTSSGTILSWIHKFQRKSQKRSSLLHAKLKHLFICI